MRRIRAGGVGEVVTPDAPSPSSEMRNELEDDVIRGMAEAVLSPSIEDAWSGYLRNCEVRACAPGR